VGYLIHDEVGMRHFYAEWSKKMNRPAFNPLGDNKLSKAA
jgi:methanesulfonate monooxygenase large subunit